jgi:hypothetical protein
MTDFSLNDVMNELGKIRGDIAVSLDRTERHGKEIIHLQRVTAKHAEFLAQGRGVWKMAGIVGVFSSAVFNGLVEIFRSGFPHGG